MDFFDKLGDMLINAGKEVSDRAKDVSDSTKLSYEIRKKKQALEEKYSALGKKIYEEKKGSDDEDIKAIGELLDEIKDMEDRYADARGGRRCAKCGAVVPMDSSFCNKCGAKFDEGIFEDETEEESKEDAE